MSPRSQTRAFGELARTLLVGLFALQASGCAPSRGELVDAGAGTDDGAVTDPEPDADVEPPGSVTLPFSRQLYVHDGNEQLVVLAHALFLTSRGTLIALFSDGHSHLDTLSYHFYARRSVDDGATWSAPVPMGNCWDCQPTLVEDAARGRIILLYDHANAGTVEQLARLTMRQSDDDGATFGEPFAFRVAVPEEVSGLRLTSATGTQLQHGPKRGQLLVLAEINDGTGRLPGLLWSDDGGHSFALTYGGLDPISDLGTARPPMSVVERSDGALLVSTVAGPRVARALSLDQETFEALPDWSPGAAHGLGNVARYDPTGAPEDRRLLQIGTASDGALSAWSSRDGGEHWGDLVVLRTLASSNTHVVVTPHGTIGALHQVASGVAFTSLDIGGLAALEECDARCVQKQFAVSVADRLDLPVCTHGARVVDWGVDETGDALIDDFEAVAGNVFCDGEAGEALVRIDDAPPGPECAINAKIVEAGYDADRDGTLSSGEVAQRFVRCPDAAPTGEALLVGTVSDIRALSVHGDWLERRFGLGRTWHSYALGVTPLRGFLTLRDGTGPNDHTEVRRPNGMVVARYSGGGLRWSPDEMSIAVIGSDDLFEPDLRPGWLAWSQVDSGKSRRIDDEVVYTSITIDGVQHEQVDVAFSPDGAQLAYKDWGSLYLVSSYEAAPTLLADGVGAWGWSYRDGQCSISQELGEESVILHAYACEPARPTNESGAAPSGCSWSASGARLLCRADNALFTTAPDGSERVELAAVEDGQRLFGDWLGGSDRLYYGLEQELHIVSGDGTGDRVVAKLAHDQWLRTVSASRDGRYLAYDLGTHGLFISSVEGDGLVRLPAHHRVASHAFP